MTLKTLVKYRSVVFLTLVGIAFVGIVAALKTVDLPPIDPVAAAAGGGKYLNEAGQLSVDQSFYTPTDAGNTAKKGGDEVPPPAVKTPEPPPLAPDEVGADAYLVGDVVTGKIYLEKNIDQVTPFASMSKLVTAIIAIQKYTPADLIEITEQDTKVPSDETGIHAGEKYTVNELLYPLLLPSSNISAEALASHVDRQKFLEAMSSFAWEIGMDKAYFGDPTGLSDHNAGTARGFFALARYLYSNMRNILTITSTPHEFLATTTMHDSHDIMSIHPFVNDPRFLGGKTGHTVYALDTMLTIIKLYEHPIAIIVLHSPNMRERDTNILIDKVSTILAEGN